MPDLDPILDALWHDVRMLGLVFVVAGAWWLIPSALVGFVAAARTEPTRWCDLPMGILWGWLGGVPGGVAAFLVLAGMVKIAEVGRGWKSPEVDYLWFGVAIASGIIAIVTNHRTSVWYYRWKIQQLYGWKIDDPPVRPANHRYSFTLRRLLIVQIVAMFVFAIWVGARRETILTSYRWRREAAARKVYEQSLETRFKQHGWSAFSDQGALHLADYDQKVKFSEVMLQQIEPADRLSAFMLHSDSLTDVGLEILCRNSELQSVTIHSNQITDAGFEHLKQLKSLHTVRLQCPQLTGKSLELLQEIATLRELSIYQPDMPKARIEAFRAARPEVKTWMFPPLSELGTK